MQFYTLHVVVALELNVDYTGRYTNDRCIKGLKPGRKVTLDELLVLYESLLLCEDNIYDGTTCKNSRENPKFILKPFILLKTLNTRRTYRYFYFLQLAYDMLYYA